MTTRKNSRIDHLAADQALVDGITKNKARLPASMSVGSQTMTPDDIVAVIQGRIATARAVVVAEAARTDAVQADRARRVQTASTMRAVHRILVGMFEQSPAVLGDFGLQPPKVGQRTAAQKAEAAAKAASTRKTLGTKGTQQKKAALAEAEKPATPAPATTPAPKPAS
jgi:hypothetical protein